MAVAFTPTEKSQVTQALLDAGEKLFATQGLKKTSLDELVAAARIAKGSFYAFFDSKEALYLEVMLRRAPQVAERLKANLVQPIDEDGLVAVLRTVTEILTEDPIYRRLLTQPDELDAVTKRVDQSQIGRVTPYLVTPLVDYLAEGQNNGSVIDDIEPSLLLQVIRTIGLVVMHRDRFTPRYESVLDATIRTLARGMLR